MRSPPRSNAHVGSKGGTSDFRLHAEGRMHVPVALDLVGSASDAKGVSTVRLASLGIKLGKNTVALTRPATISIAPRSYGIAGLDLNIDGGTIAGAATLSPKAVSADLTVRQLPLHPLGLLAGDPAVGGTLDGHVSLSGTPEQPAARIALSTRGWTCRRTARCPGRRSA